MHFYGKNLNWSPIQQYPACQTLDLHEYLDFTKSVPLYVELIFNRVKNVAATVKIEDRRKSLLKRSLNLNIFDYEGIPLQVDDLTKGIFLDLSLTLSNTIDLESDTGIGCLNYPSSEFTSYRECDENFVYNKMKNSYNLIPFWAAKTLDEVTKYK